MSTKYPDLPLTSFPDSKQDFVMMENLKSADIATVNLFQQAMRDGDSELAQQYYKQIDNADSKFITADKLNALYQTCIALQRFYEDDVSAEINKQKQIINDIADSLTYKGAWDENTSYEKNNYVIDSSTGELYLALRDNIANPLSDTNYWRKLTIKGDQGKPGGGLVFDGEWVSGKTYPANTAVSYNNALYYTIADNVTSRPGSDNKWNLLYESYQYKIPVQASKPASATTGDLWFKVE